ncbi:MAG: hypothetical protein HGA33_06760 [Candidatus Moranbacteria bacterium]|nr:hypothetical protein [Candidatus Moranbacteria bacterium]
MSQEIRDMNAIAPNDTIARRTEVQILEKNQGYAASSLRGTLSVLATRMTRTIAEYVLVDSFGRTYLVLVPKYPTRQPEKTAPTVEAAQTHEGVHIRGLKNRDGEDCFFKKASMHRHIFLFADNSEYYDAYPAIRTAYGYTIDFAFEHEGKRFVILSTGVYGLVLKELSDDVIIYGTDWDTIRANPMSYGFSIDNENGSLHEILCPKVGI